MKLRIVLVALFLFACMSAFAAEKPPMDIPVYPGGETSMEINLTSEDLLPTLQAMLPMVKLGGVTDKISPEDLAGILKDVKRVQVLQLDVAKPATDTDVAGYYAKNLPGGEWNRVFWQKSPKLGTVALYVQGAGEKLYAFQVQQVKVDDKPVKRVLIVKTEGKIDFAKLLAVAMKAFAP